MLLLNYSVPFLNVMTFRSLDGRSVDTRSSVKLTGAFLTPYVGVCSHDSAGKH